MKKLLMSITLGALGALMALLSASCKSEKGVLSIYSIEADEEAKALCSLYTLKTGIKAQYLRASTGELINRVINEKDDPMADILLGGSTGYHKLLEKEGCLESYSSSVGSYLKPSQKAESGTWSEFCVITLAIGYNKNRFDSLFPQKTTPATWEDLLDGDYRGEVIMTNPATSSTAFLFVAGQLQRLGDDAGWKYLENLVSQVAQFPATGDAPAKLIGTGEYTLAIGYLNSFIKWKKQGFELDYISPRETMGDADCVAILKGAKNLDAAKKFVDFMLGSDAQKLFSSIANTTPINPEAFDADATISSVGKIDMIDFDSDKAAADKKAIIAKWAEITN